MKAEGEGAAGGPGCDGESVQVSGRGCALSLVGLGSFVAAVVVMGCIPSSLVIGAIGSRSLLTAARRWRWQPPSSRCYVTLLAQAQSFLELRHVGMRRWHWATVAAQGWRGSRGEAHNRYRARSRCRLIAYCRSASPPSAQAFVSFPLPCDAKPQSAPVEFRWSRGRLSSAEPGLSVRRCAVLGRTSCAPKTMAQPGRASHRRR